MVNLNKYEKILPKMTAGASTVKHIGLMYDGWYIYFPTLFWSKGPMLSTFNLRMK